MKIGIILNPNEKGQVVIPKEIREKLGINSDTPLNVVLRGSGIYIYPIEGIISRSKVENSYLKTLGKTKGVWAKIETGPTAKKRHLELSAAARRRKTW